MKNFGKTLLAAVLGGAITIGAYKVAFDNKPVIIEKAANPVASVAKYNNLSDNINLDFSTTAAVATPAVVHITSTITSSVQGQQLQQIPAPFRFFFDEDQLRQQQQAPSEKKGSGSGVIISDDGYIVTNNHVVEDANELQVVLNDKRSYTATVIGTDPSTDLALIKIDESDLPAITIGNSDNVKTGEWVMAVGNPFNLESTVTAGIVSAKGRSIGIFGGGANIESFIQTDAAVNPGNSGGALVNLNGELIGINTAIASPTGSYSGYSFAVPSNLAKKVVDDLMQYGKVQRAFLGVRISDLNGDLARELKANISQGVVVGEVNENSSAEEGGIEQGDIIVKVDNKKVNSVPQLQEIIGGKRPGDEVSVVVNRNGSEKTLDVVLKGESGTEKLVSANKSELLQSLGAEFTPITKEDQSKYRIQSGIKVNKLYAGKLRAQTNIREGFIITRINKQDVTSIDQLEQMLSQEDGGVLIEGINPETGRKEYHGFGM
ncbi:Do family serine endopeptidase [Chondrinema litorale]|uniref:Do family serine endopeptidase n=1 Tax=Chondrinema litorale TaxID=2994555 RepID=UPI002543E672|nr:Do family serine endopeptidase [Chondrinema litorale]UZR94802.1 Do family serine endopeptidase [Chondrinema litorale]